MYVHFLPPAPQKPIHEEPTYDDDRPQNADERRCGRQRLVRARLFVIHAAERTVAARQTCEVAMKFSRAPWIGVSRPLVESLKPMNAAILPKKILLVDDEPQIIEVLDRYLTDDGFIIIRAHDGLQALEMFREEHPDLIVLDINMPVMNGLEAFKIIREQSRVPVIMLTSRVDEVDRVVGLELGADDYVTKPFSPREVAARVKAVLRRSGLPVDGERDQELTVGDLRINLREHEVHVAGRAAEVTATEFHILEILAEQPGRAFTRTQLLDRIKSGELEIYDRTLDRHIANLRRKVEPDPSNPRYILTVIGVGYKMAKNP
jgi:two-component system, OmpR family, alkaline phosphatase synthesis response regulator PhoP